MTKSINGLMNDALLIEIEAAGLTDDEVRQVADAASRDRPDPEADPSAAAANGINTGAGSPAVEADCDASKNSKKRGKGKKPRLSSRNNVKGELRDVLIESLRIDEDQIRQADAGAEDDADLRDSIRLRQGIVVPLIVQTVLDPDRPGEAVHPVVDGNRRLGIVRMLVQAGELKLTHLPCIVYPPGLTRAEVLRLQYTVNADRANLTPIDVARGLKLVMAEEGYTSVNQFARSIGKPQPWVAMCFRVLRAEGGRDDDVYQAVARGKGIREACAVLSARQKARKNNQPAPDADGEPAAKPVSVPKGYTGQSDVSYIDEAAGLAIVVYAPRGTNPPLPALAARLKTLCQRVKSLARKESNGKEKQ